MENKSTTMTNTQGKKKIHPLISSLRIGGERGIAGLFVFGGALAIAGFMAVASFASNKHKAKGTHDHQPKPKSQQMLLDDYGSKEDHDTTQSLNSLIQHGDATCWSMNQVSNSSELLSAESLILEEKSEINKSRSEEDCPTRFHQQEIAFSDHSHPSSAASSNESGVAEECLVSSLLNSPSGQPQDGEPQDDDDDDLTSSETDTENEDGEDDDDVSEIGEEDSSKASGTTSLGYKEEPKPVWPAKRRFKGDSHVCADSDADGSDYDVAITVAKHNQNLSFFMVLNNQALTWVFPLLLLALLLLVVLLTRRPQESFYVLDENSSVVKRI